MSLWGEAQKCWDSAASSEIMGSGAAGSWDDIMEEEP